jgi:hypothetical protein
MKDARCAAQRCSVSYYPLVMTQNGDSRALLLVRGTRDEYTTHRVEAWPNALVGLRSVQGRELSVHEVADAIG